MQMIMSIQDALALVGNHENNPNEPGSPTGSTKIEAVSKLEQAHVGQQRTNSRRPLNTELSITPLRLRPLESSESDDATTQLLVSTTKPAAQPALGLRCLVLHSLIKGIDRRICRFSGILAVLIDLLLRVLTV